MADIILEDRFNDTAEEIRARVFSSIAAQFIDPNQVPDMREGSLIWTIAAAIVMEFLQFNSNLDQTLKSAFIQYAEGTYLDAKGEEVGVSRLPAKFSTGVVRFFGDNNTNVPSGTTVSTTSETEFDVITTFDTNVAGTIVETSNPLDINEEQTLELTGPTAGTFSLTFNAETTAAIPFNSSSNTIQTALEGLATPVPGDFSCNGGPLPFNDVVVTFTGAYAAADQPLITANATSLIGLNEIQEVAAAGTVSGGTFTLTYNDGFNPSETTAPIAWNASAAAVKTALTTAPITLLVGADIITAGGPLPGTPVSIEFTGAHADINENLLAVDDSLITGGGGLITATLQDGVDPTASVTETVRGGSGTPTAILYPRNEIQQISEPLPASAGTFTLTYDDGVNPTETTNPIAYNASALAVETALTTAPITLLSPGDVIVAAGPLPGQPITVEFTGARADINEIQLIATPDLAFTTSGGTISVTTLQQGEPTGGTAVTGDVRYKYTYVTQLGDDTNENFEFQFGETAGSVASNVYTLSSQSAQITIGPVPPTVGLNTITKVRFYRQLDEGSGFSEFLLIDEIPADNINPMIIIDNIPNVDFNVIETVIPEGNTTGVIDIASTCNELGSDGNIPANRISLLESPITDVTKVTNHLGFSSGTDEELDDAYRARMLQEIQKTPGAGNIADYITWAREVSGVEGVTVIPEWQEIFGGTNGPGTVKVVVSGANGTLVNHALVESVRQHIAGDIALISPYAFYSGELITTPDAYGMVAVDSPGGNIDAGNYEYVITFLNVGDGETEHSAIDENGDVVARHVYGRIIPFVVGASGSQVTLSAVPVGQTGTGVTATTRRRIYRRNTASLDPRFYLVGTIADNGTTVFVDSLNDVDIYPSNTVQNNYAPVVNSTSKFNGEAPIGAHVTVESISSFAIKVDATIIPDAAYSVLGLGGKINLGNLIRSSLQSYFDTVDAGTTIFIKDVENAIHDTTGVKDFRNVVLFTADTGATISNIGAPDSVTRPVFDATGTLTEVAS
jgi:uncharacterized phage protein gp47/JayE